MRISIYTGPWLPVPPVKGGATNRIWLGLAREFARMEHTTTMLSRAYIGQHREESENGLKYIRRGGFAQSKYIGVSLARDLLYGIGWLPSLPKSDVIVMHDFWMPFLARLRRSHVGKIVVVVGRHPKIHYALLYRHVDLFVAQSDAGRDALLKRYSFTKSKVSVIPCPVDQSFFKVEGSPSSSPQGRVILYVGRIHPEKGLDLLVDAFRQISASSPDVTLRIVGPEEVELGGGGSSYLAQLKARAGDAPVDFVGPIFDIERLGMEYKKASVFCYPSLAEYGESFGVAPLEAMACGLVPVVSDLSCFRGHVVPGSVGYVFDHRSPQAAQELGESLMKALSTEAEEMKLVVRERALEYQYSKIANRYLEAFQNLVNER